MSFILSIVLLKMKWWSDLLSTLNAWDTWLFLKINTQWISGVGDVVFPIIRNSKTTIPLYVFLLFFVFRNFSWKSVLIWLLAVIFTIGLSDQFSSTFLKNFFDRVRPCNEPSLAGQMRFLLSYRPRSGSFTSSHAVNNFALATFFFTTLKTYFSKWSYLFFVWAALICYAQVYVGVHYPGDVLGGALVGWLIGWSTASVFNEKQGFTLRSKSLA